MGQRRLHLLAGRQSAGRPGRGQARLLARLRRHGGVPAGRRRRQGAGGMDDPWRAGGGRLRPRHRPLRALHLQSRIYPANHRRVLRPPLRDDLSERAIARRPAAQDGPGLRRDDRRRLPLGILGLEVPLFFAPAGFEEKPTLRRSNAFDIVGDECRMVREGVGLLDIASFSRYEVTGRRLKAGSTG